MDGEKAHSLLNCQEYRLASRMLVFGSDWQSWLIKSRLVRQVALTVLRQQSRRQLELFDSRDPARTQASILRGLVHQAQSTEFGKAHDFGRVRTPADFRRLVPLCTEDTSPKSGSSRHMIRRIALTAVGLGAREQPRGHELSINILTHRSVSPEATLLPILLRPFVQFTRGDLPSDSEVSRSGATVLQGLWLFENLIALDDPRYGRRRLLTDHGMFFEFVPCDQRTSPCPPRYTIGEIQRGVSYQIALTAPGLWAYLSDVVVCFDKLKPPLFNQLLPAVARPSPHPAIQAPHRPGAGIPAVPPETIVHNPWSIPADQG
jgi:hypothetical protein